MSECAGCGRPTPSEAHNWCSWECQVRVALESGGTVITPNKLPIRCIRHDGALLEHEHADHPTYMYPVSVEYLGEVDDRDREDAREMTGRGDVTDDECRRLRGETHALVYCDGCVALTLYECCYAIWSVGPRFGGELEGGSLWFHGKWKLSAESLKKVRGG